MNKKDIKSFSLKTLTLELTSLGLPTFRAGQIFSWLHEKCVSSFEEMTNVSKELREQLESIYYINQLSIGKKQISKIDGTIKYLYKLQDGNAIETVLMEHKYGTSLCISTQVGCSMGCGFCASTLGGKMRNLTTSEMLDQVYASGNDNNSRIDTIVLMGIGEPLDNFDNVIAFLEIISNPKGKQLSLRSITLSTCGLVDVIYKLAEYRFPITLSISLHAVTDTNRTSIMPINAKWNIAALMVASKAYFATTGRRISYEYALIKGENDTSEDAIALSKLLKRQNCHVNLIPINPVRKSGFERSQKDSVLNFATILQKRGVPATIRRELGTDISAACGQLRHEEAN